MPRISSGALAGRYEETALQRPLPHGAKNQAMRTPRPTPTRPSCTSGFGVIACGLAGAVAVFGCALFGPSPPPTATPEPALEIAARDTQIYRQAQIEQTQALEREVQRLRAELNEAESAMAAIESGLKGAQTRADAVSALAEARISVERARAAAPWRRTETAELSEKLQEAERQFQAGNTGTAVFFASRAKRIADGLREEARQTAETRGTRKITAARANLRAGPSTAEPVLFVLSQATPVQPQRSDGEWVLVRTPGGAAGWVHASLLEAF